MAADRASPKHSLVERKDLVVVHEYCPDRPYIELEVPQDFHAALYVEFTSISRDQGWTSESVGHSWSWFDASVRRPGGRNNLRNIRLYTNEVAKPNFHEHSLQIVPTHPWGVNWKPWITSLQPGDVIELVPKAIYPGWLNIVRESRIELKYWAKGSSIAQDDAPPFMLNAPLYARKLSSEYREIRVLAIHPGAFDDPISCHITYVQLGSGMEDQDDFDALSYSWGDDPEYATIDVNRSSTDSDGEVEKITITRSAETALRYLRPTSHILMLWIDIVCINQADNDERAQQVGLMATIFSLARTVHVWLGVHEGIEAALLIARDIYNFEKRSCSGGDECSCEGSPHTRLDDVEKVAQAHKDWTKHKAIRAVFEFHYQSFTHKPREYAGGLTAAHIATLMAHVFENPWFRRVWVIQEVLRANRALVHCGLKTITWQELTTVNSWLDDREFTNTTPHIQPSPMPTVWTYLSQASIHDQESSPTARQKAGEISPKPGVLEAYLASLDLKSKEQRDKLFAVLSFGDETSQVNSLPSPLRPDYHKPLQLVFADFTRWWIIRHKSLAILSYIHSSRVRTWQRVLCDTGRVPNIPKPSWAIPMDGTQRWSQATLEAQFHFQASEQTLPDVKLLSDTESEPSNRMLLPLLGYKVSIISRIAHLPAIGTSNLPTASQAELLAVLKTIFDTGNAHERWKSRMNGDPVVVHQTIRSRERDHVYSHLTHDEHQPPVIEPFKTSKRGAQPSHQRSGDMMIPVASCADPYFFTAANGMLGVCPWRAREGDVIALLLGGDVPFLLRPGTDTTATFELVGECFVMGIMHGELMRELERAGDKAEVLTLL